MFVKLFFRPEKYIYTFISDSRFETILKHLKLVWHLNSHMYFKVHKTFNCVDIFILLQTNLHIDITSSFIVTYCIFINPFGPIVYYSPKNTPINKMPFYLIKSKCLVFLNFFDSDESVRLKLLMSHCFQAQENWPKDKIDPKTDLTLQDSRILSTTRFNTSAPGLQLEYCIHTTYNSTALVQTIKISKLKNIKSYRTVQFRTHQVADSESIYTCRHYGKLGLSRGIWSI